MYAQIGELYINIDNVNLLGVYDSKKDDGYEIGIILNNEKYCIYDISGMPPAKMKEDLQNNVRGILDQIITYTNQACRRINVPTVDLTKYFKAEQLETEEVKKEQIND